MTTTPTQEEIKAVAVELRKHSPYASCYEAEEAIDRAADLIERLAAEREDRCPTAWMRGIKSPNTVDGPGEWDCDFVCGDDCPEGDGWIPLYKNPPHVDSVSAHIKPLEWLEGRDEDFRADTPFGQYNVYKVDCDHDGWRWGYCFDEYYDEDNFTCDDAEDGKAKAWAHWVERISPMLTEGPAIPDGWKLVPIEPTPEMARCLESNIAECLPASEVHVANWRNAYRAMLNASPSPGGTSDAD